MTEQEERDRMAFQLDALLAIVAIEIAVRDRRDAERERIRQLPSRRPTVNTDWLRRAS